MGHHYVPQAHLKRFEVKDSPGIIWMYDKTNKSHRQLPIKTVAQQSQYYDNDVEQALNEVIEIPGNALIEKLCRRENINNPERTQLSLYIWTMATRGPRRRREFLESAPDVLNSTFEEIRTQIEEWIQLGGEDQIIAERRLRELEEARQKFSNKLPQNIVDQLRSPFISERCLEAIHNMTWHILPSLDRNRYLTSDTPAHLFPSLGVGRPESEFTIALSKEIALIGSHDGKPASTVFEKPKPYLVKEVNRRIVSHAERFVFSDSCEEWVPKLAHKELRLHKIQWR